MMSQTRNDFITALINQTAKSMGKSIDAVEKDFKDMNNKLVGRWSVSGGTWFRFDSNDRYEFGNPSTTFVGKGIYQAVGDSLFIYDDINNELVASFEFEIYSDHISLVGGGYANPMKFFKN